MGGLQHSRSAAPETGSLILVNDKIISTVGAVQFIPPGDYREHRFLPAVGTLEKYFGPVLLY